MRKRQPTERLAQAGDVATAPIRPHVLRAAAFGAVSATIGVLGHAWATQHAPSRGVLTGAFALLSVYALLAARRRVRGPTIVAAVTVAQALVHVAATVLGGGAHQHHGAPGHGGVAAALGVSPDVPLWAMLGGHALAILAGSALLLRLEARIWRGLHAATRQLGRKVVVLLGARCFPATRRAASVAARRPPRTPSRALRCATCRWLVVASGRRGPPLVRIA